MPPLYHIGITPGITLGITLGITPGITLGITLGITPGITPGAARRFVGAPKRPNCGQLRYTRPP
jgi:hypothetical protein